MFTKRHFFVIKYYLTYFEYAMEFMYYSEEVFHDFWRIIEFCVQNSSDFLKQHV